jgi:hypothetical protein
MTINYAEVDSQAAAFHLNASQAAGLDAGLTAHETSHAGSGPGIFALAQMHGERFAYTNESITYQGLHNTDVIYKLWSETWANLPPEQIEQNREQAVEENVH